MYEQVIKWFYHWPFMLTFFSVISSFALCTSHRMSRLKMKTAEKAKPIKQTMGNRAIVVNPLWVPLRTNVHNSFWCVSLFRLLFFLLRIYGMRYIHFHQIFSDGKFLGLPGRTSCRYILWLVIILPRFYVYISCVGLDGNDWIEARRLKDEFN